MDNLKLFMVHVITTVTEYTRAAIEKKQLGQSFIDLQKAFDTLNHEILVSY